MMRDVGLLLFFICAKWNRSQRILRIDCTRNVNEVISVFSFLVQLQAFWWRLCQKLAGPQHFSTLKDLLKIFLSVEKPYCYQQCRFMTFGGLGCQYRGPYMEQNLDICGAWSLTFSNIPLLLIFLGEDGKIVWE